MNTYPQKQMLSKKNFGRRIYFEIDVLKCDPTTARGYNLEEMTKMWKHLKMLNEQ